MRVFVVVHGFPPTAEGGTELYARAHAAALQKQFGDEILVLTRTQDPARPDYDIRRTKRDGLRIVEVNNTWRHVRRFEDTYRNDTIGGIAARLIDEFGPDVAHVHHLTGLSTTIVRMLAERRVPTVLTLHDYWLICHRGQLLDLEGKICRGPESAGCDGCLGSAGAAGAMAFAGARAVRAIERRLPAVPGQQLRRAAGRLAPMLARGGESSLESRKRLEHMREVCADVRRFLAPCAFVRDRFVQFGVEPEKITLAPLGIEVARPAPRRPGRAPGDCLRVGLLGSLMASKAPHVLLEAVERLPPGLVRVDLFGAYAPYHGDDSYRSRLEPLLRQHGVLAHGAIPHERVGDALASLDVLVVPSVWPENSPLVIHEAFSAGVPVVASRIGGIPELVADGRNGLLFPPGDVEELARRLRRLVDDPTLVDRLRAGISSVRTIEDDAGLARRVYEAEVAVLRRRRGRRRLAAVVLNYRTPDETYLAVRSLTASRRQVDDLIVVNNDEPDEGLHAAVTSACRDIVWLDTGRNLGFSGGMNAGIREALVRGADRVLLVNSDTIAPPDAIERLEGSLDTSPRAGVAGPIVLARSAPDQVASLGMSYRRSSGRMRHRGFGRPLAGPPPPEDAGVDAVSGCFMLVRRDVFEAVGLLDEEYFFSFEELDFCLRARRAGFTTVRSGAAIVYHEGGRSIGATSPRRLYFAARNHLRLARRVDPDAGALARLRLGTWIVALNVAHAVRFRGGSLAARVGAVARGVRDYLAGRFGEGHAA